MASRGHVSAKMALPRSFTPSPIKRTRKWVTRKVSLAPERQQEVTVSEELEAMWEEEARSVEEIGIFEGHSQRECFFFLTSAKCGADSL